MTYLPQNRTSELVVQEFEHEILIYDLKTHTAISLNKTSAIVYQACNGTTTFEELKRLHKFTDDLIYLTLDKLAANDLLEGYASDHFSGLSRREVIKRVGLATMIALPVISAIVAPHPAQAASGSSGSTGTCVPLNACQAAGTLPCPPGCTGIYNFIGYPNSTNGSCSGPTETQSYDCAPVQGFAASLDYRRTS